MTNQKSYFGADSLETSVTVDQGRRPIHLRVVADERLDLRFRLSADDALKLSEQLRLAVAYLRGSGEGE